MTHNFNDLDDLVVLHEMFTAAGIEHRYTYGDLTITVFRGDYAWTVSKDCIIYWGGSTDGIDVCKSRCREFAWTSDAYDYIADVYSKVK